MAELTGKRVAILATDMFEQVELVEPRKALDDAGAETEIVSLEKGEIQAFNHYDKADKFPVDKTIDEVTADDYDALMLPVGAICHAPWMLVEADVVRGRPVTSWPSLKTDIRNAGGNWQDKEVIVDDGLVTSRKPDDIPAFSEKIIEEFAEGRHAAQMAAVGAGTAQS
jgi:protease I